MKQITVFQSQTSESQIIEVEDNITTWGQLRPLIEFDLENKKVVCQNNATTLDLDDAMLPPGDLTLFIYVSQSKAGASIDYSSKEGQKKIKELANNNLRRTIRRHNERGVTNIDTSLDTETQRKLFADHFKSTKRKKLSEVEKEPVKKAPVKKAIGNKAPVKQKPDHADIGEANLAKKDFIKEVESHKPFTAKRPNTITIELPDLSSDDAKVLDAIIEVSNKLDKAIENLESLPELIAQRIKETSTIVKAAKELKVQSDRFRRQLGL